MATLAREDYRRRVYGCWLGKTIGGTLGAPHEGRQQLLDLAFYDPVPTGAVANDDLDLQLVWLAALREHGPGLDERTLGDAWRRHLVYPFDEYGIALWNLGRGLEPPLSGQFANHFGDCMGAPIRSEIWACVAPGCPGLGARYAYYDGCVDHSGEGIYGEMFLAALESAAFVCDDRDRLLDIGLGLIPPDCRTAGAVRLTRELHAEGLAWTAARERILAEWGHVNFTDAPQNIAFTILGWLWGEDAGDALCKAVNCGYDTDCTGATLGALLGLLHGPEVFDPKWAEPVGEEVVVGWGVVGCETPATLQELTDWTLAEAERMLAHHKMPLRLGKSGKLDPALLETLAADAVVAERLAHHGQTLHFSRELGGRQRDVYISLGGPPAMRPMEERKLELNFAGCRAGLLHGYGEHGWQVEALGCDNGHCHLLLKAPRRVQAHPAHRVSIDVGLASGPCELVLVPACGWRVAGPVAVPDALAALDHPPDVAGWRPVWTADHRLELDDGAETDRIYRVTTTLAIGDGRHARLVCATPELQRVWLDRDEVLVKREPTAFIPAAHRSGPGTATTAERWRSGEHTLQLLLAVRAGQPAVVHVFITRPADIQGPRLVPYDDLVIRMPG
ncbi:MAG: ADP-ribosylglycohydrolase family protein [Armatimonadetes bacterium]|nr:ADP-ribosylglycohydrolase family protein [Armatimonadota bacterium]